MQTCTYSETVYKAFRLNYRKSKCRIVFLYPPSGLQPSMIVESCESKIIHLKKEQVLYQSVLKTCTYSEIAYKYLAINLK